jgi:hypothetical protein
MPCPIFQFIVSAVRSWAKEQRRFGALHPRTGGGVSLHARARQSRGREDHPRLQLDRRRNRETLKLYFEPDRGVFPKQGELDLKGLGQVLQFMAETGDLKPPLPPAERFVDLQYLRAAGLQ